MRKLKNWFSLVALFALSGSLAQAGGKELKAFFDGFEGRWDGRGARQALLSEGKFETIPYRMEMDNDSSGRDLWTTQAEFTTESGIHSYADLQFRVEGDLLYISSVSPIDPVEVLESSSTKLSWRSYRTDWILRRTFVTTTTFELSSKRELRFEEQVTLNGALVQADSARLKR